MRKGKRFLIAGKAIYDVDTHSMSEYNCVLVENGSISNIGMLKDLSSEYPNLEIQRHDEGWLLPGLINTHVHLQCNPYGNFQESFENDSNFTRFTRALTAANMLLRSGVTTVRDAGSDWDVLALKDPEIQSMWQLPRLRFSGPPLTITGGHLHFMGGEVDTIVEAVKAIRTHQKLGCDAIKIMATGGQMTSTSRVERLSFTTSDLQTMVHEARHLDLPTFAHCLTTESFIQLMNSEIDSIEHCAWFVRNKNGLLQREFEEEKISVFKGSGRLFSNTLASLWHKLDGYRSGAKQATWKEVFLIEQEKKMLDAFSRMCDLRFVPVLATDAGTPATWFDDTALELEIMVERCNLTPAEAIDVATVNAAKSLKESDVIGKIANGYYADIVVLRENPLVDISAWRKIAGVYVGGEAVNNPSAREKGDLYA